VKIISPFALATAYFAMPSTVIPFSLTHQAFVIFTFVIMAVVALLFVITEIVHNHNGWKKRCAVYMRSIQRGELVRYLWTRENGNPPTPKRSHSGFSIDQPLTSESTV
jgi:hypothetical protein